MSYIKKFIIPFLLLICWLILQVFLYEKFQVKIMNDTHRYMEYAQDVVYNGVSWQEHNRWYLGFVLFLSVFVKIGAPLVSIVVSQALLSLISIITFCYAISKEYGEKVAYVLGFFLVFWFKISEWNFYLLTESLYTSLLLLVSALLILNKKIFVPLLIILMGLFFITRPTSVLFLSSLLIVLFLSHKWNATRGALFLVVALVGSYFLLNKMLESFIIVEAMERREAIFAYSTNPNFPMWDWVVFDVDKELDYPDPSYSQVVKMLLFVIYNPIFFFKLSLAKLFYFYAHVKPYFSWKHNLFVVFFLWSAYFFMFKGIKLLKHHHKFFLISYLILNGVMVILCSEDWDGRFLIPVLPIVFVGSSIGVVQVMSVIKKF